MNHVCAECIYQSNVPWSKTSGFCKKHAPRPALSEQMVYGKSIGTDTIWPIVRLDEPACGEFKRRVPAESERRP